MSHVTCPFLNIFFRLKSSMILMGHIMFWCWLWSTEHRGEELLVFKLDKAGYHHFGSNFYLFSTLRQVTNTVFSPKSPFCRPLSTFFLGVSLFSVTFYFFLRRSVSCPFNLAKKALKRSRSFSGSSILNRFYCVRKPRKSQNNFRSARKKSAFQVVLPRQSRAQNIAKGSQEC